MMSAKLAFFMISWYNEKKIHIILLENTNRQVQLVIDEK